MSVRDYIHYNNCEGDPFYTGNVIMSEVLDEESGDIQVSTGVVFTPLLPSQRHCQDHPKLLPPQFPFQKRLGADTIPPSSGFYYWAFSLSNKGGN